MAKRIRVSNGTVEQRLWARTDRRGPDECWPWIGGRHSFGYGRFDERRQAHRVAWEVTHGPIAEGLHVCHRCDNPPCVNPAHLFLGTHTDNMRDCADKGRTNKPGWPGESNPFHKLTAEQVREIRRRYALGTCKQYDLAAEFGVSKSLVGAIVTGKAWAWLEAAPAPTGGAV